MESQIQSSAFTPVPGDFQSRIRNEVCGMKYEVADHRRGVRCGLRGLHLGTLDFIHFESDGVQRGTRTFEDIRHDGADDFMVSIPVQSVLRIVHNGRTTETGPGKLTIISTKKPFSGCVYGVGQDAFTFMQIRMPGPLFRRYVGSADEACNEVLSLDTAAGHILQSLLDAVVRHGDGLTTNQAQHLGSALGEAVLAAVQPLLNDAQSVMRRRRVSHELLVERALSYIEANLSDPGLSVPLVAEHCRISARYLQTLFQRKAVSVALHIRELRLQRCRDALRDPRQSHRSVLEIANDWGFSDPAHFSRLYKAQFGTSPTLSRL